MELLFLGEIRSDCRRMILADENESGLLFAANLLLTAPPVPEPIA